MSEKSKETREQRALRLRGERNGLHCALGDSHEGLRRLRRVALPLMQQMLDLTKGMDDLEVIDVLLTLALNESFIRKCHQEFGDRIVELLRVLSGQRKSDGSDEELTSLDTPRLDS